MNFNIVQTAMLLRVSLSQRGTGRTRAWCLKWGLLTGWKDEEDVSCVLVSVLTMQTQPVEAPPVMEDILHEAVKMGARWIMVEW